MYKTFSLIVRNLAPGSFKMPALCYIAPLIPNCVRLSSHLRNTYLNRLYTSLLWAISNPRTRCPNLQILAGQDAGRFRGGSRYRAGVRILHLHPGSEGFGWRACGLRAVFISLFRWWWRFSFFPLKFLFFFYKWGEQRNIRRDKVFYSSLELEKCWH